MTAILRSEGLRSFMLVLFGVLVVSFASLYAAYGQADPCRALAVERARRSHTGLASEPWSRLVTSQMSTGACASGLLDSWGERLTHYMPDARG